MLGNNKFEAKQNELGIKIRNFLVGKMVDGKPLMIIPNKFQTTSSASSPEVTCKGELVIMSVEPTFRLSINFDLTGVEPVMELHEILHSLRLGVENDYLVTEALKRIDKGEDTIETEEGILILSFQHKEKVDG